MGEFCLLHILGSFSEFSSLDFYAILKFILRLFIFFIFIVIVALNITSYT